MAKSTAQAAETLVHYIRLALTASNVPMSGDCHQELNDAIEAFRAADKAAYELHSLHP